MSALALHSPRVASVDHLRSGRASAAAQVAGVVGFALLAALGAQFELRLWLWEVPLTLQTLAFYSAGLYLGARNGALSMALYLALGLVLPVFAGGASGVEHLLGPTGGYLFGAPLAAAVVGALSRRWNAPVGSLLAILAGSVVLFTCGVTVLHYAAGHATWLESLDKGWLRFVGWDLTKVALVAAVYGGLRRLTA